MADPEGRKTLRNSLRGFPVRVYPVGNLEYAASGVILLTNDGDLAAALLKNWEHLEQAYHIKVKGMLTLHDLAQLGKEAGVRMQTLRQPDSTRGRAANFWYEVRMRDTRKKNCGASCSRPATRSKSGFASRSGRSAWKGFREAAIAS